MKKSLIICTFLFSVISISCSRNNLMPENTPIQSDRNEFQRVISEIDQLNCSFGCPRTKNSERELLCSAADFYGGLWGSYIFGAVGGIAGMYTGSPNCALFLCRVGGVVGGTAVSSVASTIYGMLYDEGRAGSSEQSNILLNPGCDRCILNDNPTFGAVHNEILWRLENNGKNYFDNDGTIMISELFNDALQYEKDICYPNGGGYVNQTYLHEFESFLYDITVVMKDSIQNNASFNQLSNSFSNILLERGVEKVYIDDAVSLYHSLSPCVALNDDLIDEYEESFSEILQASKLADQERIILGTSGSVLIHSASYWY